jgi:hydrogenase nickel incorporation protein HypA/HybF
MHEFGIMQSALSIAEDWAGRNHAQGISRVSLRIGALSGVVPDALQFAFDALKLDTLAREATLEVEFVPLLLHCPDCEHEFTTDGFTYVCPDCGRPDTEIWHGQELEVARVELISEGGCHEPVAGAMDR